MKDFKKSKSREVPLSSSKKKSRRSIDVDWDQVGCAIIVIGLVAGIGFCVWQLGYSAWYNGANMDVVDSGKATKLYTDNWGHWVTINNRSSWHIEEQAWTTIRIGDNVTVYQIYPQWEVLVTHRIAIE